MKIILDSNAMNRALTRISHEIIEHNKGTKDVVILGVKTRGVPLAKRIVEKINHIENVEVPMGELDITFYRDDLDHQFDAPMINNQLNMDVENKVVIVVDDVVYTGRTCRAALDAVFAAGRAKKIQFVSLIDRGHRELPLVPNFIGKNVPTSKDEMVQVKLLEIDGVDEVVLKRRD